MSQKLVKITLDGKELEVAEGASVLQVAMDHGTMVPHFCYHPGIGVDGNCRLCLVEVEGMPKLATSCNLYAKEGMIVRTQSDPVVKARKGVLEFFLLNHPLDCPFCDKGGECPLQNYTYDSGQFTTRFEFEKNHKPKHQDIGEHIVLDKERCVLCSRCVRFGRDLAGHEELQITSRGSKSEIFVPATERLESKFTGNYADICPVGALTTKEYRFKARPWELKTVNTLCGECSLGCNVQAWRKKEDVLRLTPRIEANVNEWWLCDRGRFSVNRDKQEARVTTVYKRNAHALEKMEPTTAIAELALALQSKTDAEGKIGLIADSSLSNEEFFQLKTLAKSIPSSALFAPIRGAIKRAFDAVQAQKMELNFPQDIEQSKSLLVIGEVIEDEHPVLAIRFRNLAHKKGLRLFTANTVHSELDRIASATKVSDWPVFFDGLAEFVAKNQITNILLSDKVILAGTEKKILEVISQLAKQQIKLSILHSGTNDRGILDQWDAGVLPLESLASISLSALVSFGDHESQLPVESLSSLSLFVHATRWLKNASTSANWILPLDSFLEKNGTYTNHFGKVQTLRRSTKQVETGARAAEILAELANAYGENTLSTEQAYAQLAGSVAQYPKKMEEIPESTQTYHHYERAVWR